MALVSLVVSSFLFVTSLGSNAIHDYCCKCDSDCSNKLRGIMIYDEALQCKYNISSPVQNLYFLPGFLSAPSGGVSVITDGATRYIDESEVSLQSFSSSPASEGLITLIIESQFQERLYVEYQQYQLFADKQFAESLCDAEIFTQLYGSVEISVWEDRNAAFYTSLMENDSLIFSVYSSKVKEAIRSVLYLADLDAFNVDVFSFSPAPFCVNFAVEIIGEVDTDRVLEVFSENLPTRGGIGFEVESLQLAPPDAATECLFLDLLMSPIPTSIEDDVRTAVGEALDIYCDKMHICDSGIWHRDFVVTIQNRRFLPETKAFRVTFCVQSILMERQIIEAIHNNLYVMETNYFGVDSLHFPYEIPIEIVTQKLREGVDGVFLIPLAITVGLLLILLLFTIFLVVLYFRRYKNKKKVLGEMYGSTSASMPAVRASRVDMILRNGPQQSYMRPESSAYASNYTLAGPNMQDRKSTHEVGAPKSGEEYDHVNEEYLRKSQMAHGQEYMNEQATGTPM